MESAAYHYPSERQGHRCGTVQKDGGIEITQAIAETLFDAAYLATVITIGVLMILRSKGNRQFLLFGWMDLVLGAGDAFHLVPRALALYTMGQENYTVREAHLRNH